MAIKKAAFWIFVTAAGTALGTWAFGVLDDVWAGLMSAMAFLWNSAWTPVALPLWIVGILLIALALLAWPHAVRMVHLSEVVQLNSLERRIIGLYWILEDKHIDPDFLNDAFKEHRFRIEQAADHLVELGLLEPPSPGRTVYRLTRAGRDISADLGELVRQRWEEEESTTSTVWKELSDLERDVLSVFADRDGGSMRRDTLEDVTGEKRLHVEQAVEQLMAVGLLTHSSEMTFGVPSYVLTPKGRDLLIEHDFA